MKGLCNSEIKKGEQREGSYCCIDHGWIKPFDKRSEEGKKNGLCMFSRDRGAELSLSRILQMVAGVRLMGKGGSKEHREGGEGELSGLDT